jgi:hypothetical protein
MPDAAPVTNATRPVKSRYGVGFVVKIYFLSTVMLKKLYGMRVKDPHPGKLNL